MVALDEQTVVVPGTAAAETVLPRLADALRDVLHRRAELAAQVEEILDAHPLASVLISMPGIGIRTAALICLARRRCEVIFAMLRDRKPYQPRPLPAT
jgi:transposase